MLGATRMTESPETYERQSYVMQRACRYCGAPKGSPGSITTRNGQDLVYCASCGQHSYNAPRTETNRGVRPLGTRPGIAPSKRARILERDNYTCILCHRPDVPLDVGHLISVNAGQAQGLTDREIYADENLAAMCAPCNSGMSDTPVSLRQLIVVLRARLQNLRENGPAHPDALW